MAQTKLMQSMKLSDEAKAKGKWNASYEYFRKFMSNPVNEDVSFESHGAVHFGRHSFKGSRSLLEMVVSYLMHVIILFSLIVSLSGQTKAHLLPLPK